MSGTKLFEANALCIDSIGTDISVFNAMLSRVKTYKYDIKLLDRELHDILNKLHDYKMNSLRDKNTQNRFTTTNNIYLNEWFADQARRELLCYSHLIANYRCKGLLKIILSRAARSARLVTHYDLDFP